MKNSFPNKYSISIVTALTGGSGELEGFLLPLFKQDLGGLEIILVADGASLTNEGPGKPEKGKTKTDAKAKLLKEAERIRELARGELPEASGLDAEIRILYIGEDAAEQGREAPSAGAEDTAAYFNRGLMAVRGRFFMSLTIRDRICSGSLKELYDTALNQELDLLMGGAEYEEAGEALRRRIPEDRLFSDTEAFLDTVFSDCFDKGLIGALGNKLYRTGVLDKGGLGYRQGLYEKAEAEFALRFIGQASACGTERLLISVMGRREEISDLEALIPVLKAYNELFDSHEINDDTVNAMNNSMLRQFIDELRLAYASSELNETEKLCALTGVVRKKEFMELLKDTFPTGAENKAISFMLRKGFFTGVHKLLLLCPKREGIRLRQRYGTEASKEELKKEGRGSRRRTKAEKAEPAAPEVKEDSGSAKQEDSKAPYKETSEAGPVSDKVNELQQETKEAKEPAPEEPAQTAVNEEPDTAESVSSPKEGDEASTQGELSDSELEDIKKHLEADIDMM